MPLKTDLVDAAEVPRDERELWEWMRERGRSGVNQWACELTPDEAGELIHAADRSYAVLVVTTPFGRIEALVRRPG